MCSFFVEGELRCVPMDDVGQKGYRNLQRDYEMQKFENHNSIAIKLDVYKLYTMRNQVQVENLYCITSSFSSF